MYDLLFNVPWWIPTVLFITGIALMVRGNSLQNERIRVSGAGVLLLGIGWAVMSYLVDTPKETCIKQSRRFVQSVVAKDWITFDGMLDTNARFQFVNAGWEIDGRDRLDDFVKGNADHVGVTSATITSIEASDKADTVTTKFHLISYQKFTMDTPLTSEWAADWHRATSGRWVITEIRGIEVGNVDVKDIRNDLRVK